MGIFDGIGDAVNQVGGVFKGAGEAIWEVGEGVVDLGVGLGKTAYDLSPLGHAIHGTTELYEQATGNQANLPDWLPSPERGAARLEAAAEVVGTIVEDPGLLVDAVTAPIVDDWNNGNYGEAIGRGIIEVAGVVVGTKGIDKAAKAGKVASAADAAGDAGRVARAAENAEDVADAGRAADTARDVDRTGDAARTARNPARLDDSFAQHSRPAERATAQRLADDHPEFDGRTFEAPPPPDPGHDWVDDLGRTYDALGDGTRSQYFKLDQFTRSIDSHLLKSNDFTVIDMTGYTPQQIGDVARYVDSLTPAQQAKIVRVGF